MYNWYGILIAYYQCPSVFTRVIATFENEDDANKFKERYYPDAVIVNVTSPKIEHNE